MQMRVRDKKTYFWWSAYVAAQWFLMGVAFILVGALGKIDLRLGLILGGVFGITGVMQWHRLSVWRRQQERRERPIKDHRG